MQPHLCNRNIMHWMPSLFGLCIDTHRCVWRRTVFLCVSWNEEQLLMLAYQSCWAVVLLTHTEKPQKLSQWFLQDMLSTGKPALFCISLPIRRIEDFQLLYFQSWPTVSSDQRTVNSIKSLVKWDFHYSFTLYSFFFCCPNAPTHLFFFPPPLPVPPISLLVFAACMLTSGDLPGTVTHCHLKCHFCSTPSTNTQPGKFTA